MNLPCDDPDWNLRRSVIPCVKPIVLVDIQILPCIICILFHIVSTIRITENNHTTLKLNLLQSVYRWKLLNRPTGKDKTKCMKRLLFCIYLVFIVLIIKLKNGGNSTLFHVKTIELIDPTVQKSRPSWCFLLFQY